MVEPIVGESSGSRRRRWWGRPRNWALILVVLASGSWLGYRAWTADPWPPRLVLAVDGGYPGPMAFSPDSGTLLTSGRDGIVLWDARTGAKGHVWTLSSGAYVYEWTFSIDGRTFAASVVSYEGEHTIELFDVASGRGRTLFKEEDERNPYIPRDLAFSTDGRSIRSVFGDDHRVHQLVTWDALTGEQTSTRMPMASAGHGNGNGNANAWAISKDGRIAATTGHGSPLVDLWDLDADRSLGQLVATTNRSVAGWAMAFADDGRTLAIGREGGSVELWDVATRRVLRSIPAHRGGYEPQRLAFSANGRILASSGVYPNGLPGNAWWDSIQSSLARIFPSLARPMPGEVVVVELATGKVLARAPASSQSVVSADGRMVATLDEDGTVKLRDVPAPR